MIMYPIENGMCSIKTSIYHKPETCTIINHNNMKQIQVTKSRN